MPRTSTFIVTYDAGSDVLYVARRQESAARGVESRSGIVWRYDRQGRLIGATVLDFYDRWSHKSEDLAAELSHHFQIPTPQAQVVVDRALEQREN